MLSVDFIDKLTKDIINKYPVIEHIDAHYAVVNADCQLKIKLKKPLMGYVDIPLSTVAMETGEADKYLIHLWREIEKCLTHTVFEATLDMFKGHKDHVATMFWSPKQPEPFSFDYAFAEYSKVLKDEVIFHPDYKNKWKELYTSSQVSKMAQQYDDIAKAILGDYPKHKLLGKPVPDYSVQTGTYHPSKAGGIHQLKGLMPGLRQSVKCPKCKRSEALWNVVQHLNDHHKMPILEIADWTESLDKEIYKLELKDNNAGK